MKRFFIFLTGSRIVVCEVNIATQKFFEDFHAISPIDQLLEDDFFCMITARLYGIEYSVMIS